MRISDTPVFHSPATRVFSAEIAARRGKPSPEPRSVPETEPTRTEPTKTEPAKHEPTKHEPHKRVHREPRAEHRGSETKIGTELSDKVSDRASDRAKPTAEPEQQPARNAELSVGERYTQLFEAIVARVGEERIVWPRPATAPGPEPEPEVRAEEPRRHGGGAPKVVEVAATPRGSQGGNPGGEATEPTAETEKVAPGSPASATPAQLLMQQIMARLGPLVYRPGTPLPTHAELAGSLHIADRGGSHGSSSEPRLVNELG